MFLHLYVWLAPYSIIHLSFFFASGSFSFCLLLRNATTTTQHVKTVSTKGLHFKSVPCLLSHAFPMNSTYKSCCCCCFGCVVLPVKQNKTRTQNPIHTGTISSFKGPFFKNRKQTWDVLYCHCYIYAKVL